MRKTVLISALCVSVMMFWAGNALAFHDGGVAYCGGCHTMHNSENGQPVDPLHQNGNLYLLKMETASDVCLSCHSQTVGSTSTNGRYVLSLNMLSPMAEQGGGDFVFLKEDNINDGHSGGDSVNWIPGYAAGHSIDAPSQGLMTDPLLSSAPGGTYPSDILGCSSCHDPHGNENFRLLNGAGEIQGGAYEFDYEAPVVDGIALSGGGNFEQNGHHNAYKSGYSAWCGNCHGDFHDELNPNLLKHPSGVNMGGDITTIYNHYNGTAQYETYAGGAPYLANVPFEDPANTISFTGQAGASSKVSCVSCHRAHATSGPNAGRWDFKVTLLSEDGAESGSWAIPDPYNYVEQRSLCNKCHKKDAHDEGSTP